jgi:hypothetical protein
MQTVDLSQQAASNSGKSTKGTHSFGQPGAAEKSTEGRDTPVVRNLLIMVAFQGVLAYHHKQLAVFAAV